MSLSLGIIGIWAEKEKQGRRQARGFLFCFVFFKEKKAEETEETSSGGK
jgi:hypothetical protein